jgi:hypothetical protein
MFAGADAFRRFYISTAWPRFMVTMQQIQEHHRPFAEIAPCRHTIGLIPINHTLICMIPASSVAEGSASADGLA